jgi:hypothetical protein
VLCVETIGKIRRRRLVSGDSISAIARDLGAGYGVVNSGRRLTIVALLRDTMLAQQVRDRRTQFGLLQNPGDLFNRKPLPLHDKTSVPVDSILPQNAQPSRRISYWMVALPLSPTLRYRVRSHSCCRTVEPPSGSPAFHHRESREGCRQRAPSLGGDLISRTNPVLQPQSFDSRELSGVKGY